MHIAFSLVSNLFHPTMIKNYSQPLIPEHDYFNHWLIANGFFLQEIQFTDDKIVEKLKLFG